MNEFIRQLFLAAAFKLWHDFVGDPQHHLWALDVIRQGGAP